MVSRAEVRETVLIKCVTIVYMVSYNCLFSKRQGRNIIYKGNKHLDRLSVPERKTALARASMLKTAGQLQKVTGNSKTLVRNRRFWLCILNNRMEGQSKRPLQSSRPDTKSPKPEQWSRVDKMSGRGE